MKNESQLEGLRESSNLKTPPKMLNRQNFTSNNFNQLHANSDLKVLETPDGGKKQQTSYVGFSGVLPKLDLGRVGAACS